MRRVSHHPPRRPGFTLIEMLLVLALLLTVTAVMYPNLRRLQLEHHLKQGVELVRLQIVSTRLHALESGMDYQFRYEPGGKRFIAVPAEYQAIQAQAAAAQNSNTATPATVYWKASGEFQVKVTFSRTNSDQSGTVGLTPQPLPVEFLAGFKNLDKLRQVAWSAPLVFKTDGSSRDFAVEIENDSGAYVVLEVRGITGGTNVSQVLRRVRR